MDEYEINSRKNKAAIVSALAHAGVKKARLTYEGEGDSGMLSYTTLEPQPDSQVVEAIEVGFFECRYQRTLQTIQNQKAELVTEERLLGLEHVLEALLWQLVEKDHDGWEEDNGGGGELVIDVERGEIKLYHFDRIMVEHHTDHLY